jgi:ribosomal protein L19
MEYLFSQLEKKLLKKKNLTRFCGIFKESLATVTKENEKKELSLKIKGCQGDPTGFGIKVESINKNEYNKFIPQEKEYFKNSLSIGFISITVKNESQIAIIEKVFNQFKPIIDELPFLKPYIEKKAIEYFLRVEGLKVIIDVVIKEEINIKMHQEMEVDFGEFQNLKFLFRSSLNGEKFFDMDIEQFIEKFFSCSLCLEATTFNVKYLVEALKITLEKLFSQKEDDEEDEEKKKNLGMNDLISFVYCEKERKKEIKKKLDFVIEVISFFIDANVTLNFNAKNFVNMILGKKDEEDDYEIREKGNDIFTSGRELIKEYGGENSKSLLESLGIYEAAKIFNIDEISASLISSKYKNGIHLDLYFPGLTKYLNDIFLSS